MGELTRNPKLKPHQLKYSGDHHVVVDNDSGASIFISNQEKGFITRLNGEPIEKHVQEIFHQDGKPISSFSKMLHDLDRFGFLDKDVNQSPKQTIRVVNGFDRIVGAFLSSTFLFVVLCILPIAGLASVLIQPPSLQFFQLGGSPAWGALFIVFGVFAFVWIAGWVHSLALAAATKRSQPVGVYLNTGFPMPLVNESAGFCLPQFQRLKVALLPALFLLSAAGELFLATSLSTETFWVEAAAQLGLSALIAFLLYTAPWFESPYSRAAQYAFRISGQTKLIYSSFLGVFQFLFGSKAHSHSKSFICWGAWTLLWPLAAIRLCTTLFRNDVPRFADQLTQDIGGFDWWVVVVLSVVIGGGAMIAAVSTIIFVARSATQQLMKRWRPQQTHLLLLLVFAVLIALASRVMLLPELIQPAVSLTVQALMGLVVAYLIIKQEKMPFNCSSSKAWYGVGLVGAFYIAEAINPSLSIIHYGWYIVAALVFINKCMNSRVTQAAFIAAISISSIAALQMSSFTNSAMFICLAILLAQSMINIPNHGSLAWHWLFVSCGMQFSAVLFNSNPSNNFASLIAQSALLIAVVEKLSSYDMTTTWLYLDIEKRPLGRLRYFAKQYFGLHLKINDELNNDEVIQAIQTKWSPAEWRSILKQWLPTLSWNELQEFPLVLKEIQNEFSSIQIDDALLKSSFERVPCLRGFNVETDQLKSIARFWVADPGDVIINQGQKDQTLAVIVSGKVDIEIHQSLVSSQTVAHLDAGAFVGEIAFLTNEPRTATVRAAQPLLAITLRRDDVSREFPEFEIHLRETAEEHRWSQRLAALPLFNELPPSLFVRSVLQTEFHQLSPDGSFNLENYAADTLYAVVNGEVQTDAKTYQAGEWIGVDSLYNGHSITPELFAAGEAQVISIPRELVKEAIEELFVQDQ